MGNVSATNELSPRPERTRISCHAAQERTANAPLRKERPMKFAEATKFQRKSGGAQWRDLRFTRPAFNSNGSVPTSLRTRPKRKRCVFRAFIFTALAFEPPELFSRFRLYLALVEHSPPVLLLDRLHNPQYWVAVDVLQWEIDEVGLWIDRYRMCVRHLQGTEQTKALSVALEDGDCP
jgi:hypothetical protein